MRGLMRWLWLFGALLCVSSCDVSSTLGSDFGIQLPGCYGPSACWKVACPCVFATVAADCMVCDPTNPTQAPNGLCNCSGIDDAGVTTGVMCLEQAQVCVGAGATCNGMCVRSSSMLGCADPDKQPPNEVASKVGDGGEPSTEKHCPYVDDTCCE
jgi:hypothetical protein